MEMIDFRFIVKYTRSFKDDQNIYFLLEYVQGKELFEVIREIGILNPFEAKFYIGQLIFVLEYFNTLNIIYRDIKPENLMVDEKGYIKLIDMGTAKILTGENGFRTFTLIGTPHYMAPEVMSGKGYTSYIDLWSMGICLYEFVCGYVPFGEELQDPYSIYREITTNDLDFPAYMKDEDCQKIIRQLLSKVPERRHGGSFAYLKAHSFFRDLDFELLFQKKVMPPYLCPTEKLDIEEVKAGDYDDICKLKKDVRTNTMHYPSLRELSVDEEDWDETY